MAFSYSQVTRSTISSSPWGATLSRSEAKQRLLLLEPGTQEYAQLQDVLLKTGFIAEVCIGHRSYKVSASEDSLLGGFGASEHLHIGKGVKLQGLEKGGKQLINREGVVLGFGHIIALAGDFYGVAGSPISLLGGTDEEKEARFLAAFDTLENADPQQLHLLVQEIENEHHAVRHSGVPHHCYSDRLIRSSQAFKKIKSDTDDLLIDNSDHFAGNALDAYKIGHKIACREAAAAKSNNDLARLKRAYALDAFACHFLTDLFAAGHIRNQRGPLELFLRDRLGFDGQFAKKLAGVLTFAQHEYDGQQGLNVYNRQGVHWRVYGDGFFFAPKNKINAEQAHHATQCSADEVYQAYAGAQLPACEVNCWIPRVSDFNHPPLYQVGEEALYVCTGNGRCSIESKKDYLLKAIPHALCYLPESYVNDFINGKIISILPFEIDPESFRVAYNAASAAKKVLVPRIERLTGHLWHVVGLASHQQVQHSVRIVQEKNEEMADVLMALSGQINQIQETVKEIQKSLEDLHRKFDLQPVTNALQGISTVWITFRDHEGRFNPRQATQLSKKLWSARVQLGALFSQNSDLVANYSKTLDKSLSPEEKKILLAKWFRQMISYQVLACHLWLLLETRVGEQREDLENGLRAAQKSIESQLDQNEKLVDCGLVCTSGAYIDLQLKKVRRIDILKRPELQS